ncbi:MULTISPECIES: carboxypeptidase-like regulatory domain-containing protein [Flammeovirga]|uniref:Carboxypeptidase regulatory-like domain-containing protein n=1 Tax=Flammeovirga agarivorans TaxID=2726742 RepID=A0A7X8SHR3_9BACT|nr:MULTISPECIES: carboxypeptidase-like regulatory domain-containing protein [Flammeovirga]NLR90430.1 carboxypeptidase regulatory-like domain-containing protein [Flammeovirga agarivorans]
MKIRSHIYLLLLFLSFACEKPTPYGDLYVQVRDEQGKEVAGGNVILYGNEEDFVDQINPISVPQQTDENGLAFFLNLDSGTYYVAASYTNQEEGIEKNNFLVNTSVKVVATEIGYRNSITVIIWDSFITHLTATNGKKWQVYKMIEVTTEEEIEVPECIQDDQWVFYRNGNFEYLSDSLNCEEGQDDNFTGSFAPVGNGSYIVIQDLDDQIRYGLYIISVSSTQMLAQYGPHLMYFKTVN